MYGKCTKKVLERYYGGTGKVRETYDQATWVCTPVTNPSAADGKPLVYLRGLFLSILQSTDTAQLLVKNTFLSALLPNVFASFI
ncbi:hypothetical protein [Sphingobacterium sp. T2]|uniref:hypothetical protein n=1 Tax=Sphingobacterium sp. T2 TaxID=1590596 RepID=UPI0012E08A25|nr:hypothetical protein [Sphingobacterium sp. T2]